jgi:nucleoside-diphosphate-sugar epimerase
MDIALTGATGALGGTVLRHLLAAGHAVRALVRSRAGRALATRQGLTWVTGALDDKRALDALVAGTDAIVHLAYCSTEETPPAGSSVAEHFVQSNVVGTLRLVERTPVTRQRQLVYASSLAVYGTDPQRLPGADRLPLDEDFPVWPRDFYGAHKAALEKIVVAASGDAGMNTSVFRLGCVLGDYPDRARDPLARTVDEARAEGVIRTRKGAWVITADDAAAILGSAVGDPHVAGRVFNTFDRWLDFAELAVPLGRNLGRGVAVACEPAPEPRPPLSRARLAERAPRFTTDVFLARLGR